MGTLKSILGITFLEAFQPNGFEALLDATVAQKLIQFDSIEHFRVEFTILSYINCCT